MLQWGRWSALPGYFYDGPDWDARQRASEITLPVLVLGFDDDPWANPEAIARLLESGQKTKIDRCEIRHAEFGVWAIGHMVFFVRDVRRKCGPLLVNGWKAITRIERSVGVTY